MGLTRWWRRANPDPTPMETPVEKPTVSEDEGRRFLPRSEREREHHSNVERTVKRVGWWFPGDWQ